LLRQGIIKTGDVLGVVAGTQMASGSTNFMRLHVVNEGVDRGGSRAQKSAVAAKTRA